MRQREFLRCFRCGGAAQNGQWHHRRSRSVRDAHQHCPCNGIWLCATCHRHVHAHPMEARTQGGWIVSRAVAFPGGEPAKAHFGTLLLACDGTYKFVTEEDQDEQAAK